MTTLPPPLTAPGQTADRPGSPTEPRLPGRPAGTVPLNVAACDECRSEVPDNAERCPNCRQTRGPFRQLVAFTRLVEATDGRLWLCLFRLQADNRVTLRWARPLTGEETRWLARQNTCEEVA